MTQDELLRQLHNLSEIELFYKDYFFSRQDPEKMKNFLSRLDIQFVNENGLQIPEANLISDGTPYAERFFFNESHTAVSLYKHPNYSPAIPHRHNFFEALYILEGSFQHTVSDHSFTMNVGDFCLVSPNTEHNLYIFSDDVIVIDLLIRRSTFEDIFFNLLRGDNILASFFLNVIYAKNSNDYILFHSGNDQQIRNMILDLFLEFENKGLYYREVLHSQLITFFAKLLRYYEKSCELPIFKKKKDVQSYALIRFIQDNYKTVMLKDVADQFHYSQEYTSRLLKSITGYTFTQLLKRIRMERATNLLRDTNATLVNICEEIGYLNPEHFIRTFKKTYGMTPNEYRCKR